MDTKHIHCMLEKIAEYGKCMMEDAVGNGNVNLCDAGQIVDMVKDLADAEYHALIAKEMRNAHEEEEEEEKYMLRMLKEEHKDEYKRMRDEYGEDEGERRFYDNYRYKSGRFAPKGRGSYEPRRSGRRRGYEEYPYMHMYPEMYGDMSPEEMRDMDRESMNRMYYSGGGSSGSPGGGSSSGGSSSGGMGGSSGMSGGSGGSSGGSSSRGYSEGYSEGSRRGYEEGYSDGERSGRSRRSNSRYDNARRGYEESKQMHGNNTKEDNDENLKNLEKVLAVIDEDVKELMPNMTASEKTMLKAKFSTWAQKIS